MKKIFKILVCFMFVALMSTALAGCMGEKELWRADLSGGNKGLFGLYGTVEDKDNSIVLKRAEGQNYAASTYFGETDKNFDWNKGGMTVELSLNINKDDFSNGDYSVWSLALNETDGAYITENTVFFVGSEDGVKFIFKEVGVDTDYEALANDEEATTIESGTYTVVFGYDVNTDGEILLSICLKNESGMCIYSSDNNEVKAIDHEEYTGGQVLKEENIKGLRYLWLARTSVDVEVTGLRITE